MSIWLMSAVCFWATLLGESPAGFGRPNLEFKLLCDKASYLVGESIWIDVLVINREKDTVKAYFPSPYFDHFNIVVIQGESDTVPYMGVEFEWINVSSLPTCKIAPGDTLYYAYDLLCGYSAPEAALDFRLKGRVRVSAVYWEIFRSNELDINIAEPQGSEAEALRLLSKGTEGPLDDGTADYLRQLVNKHPSSVYMSRALKSLIAHERYKANGAAAVAEYSLRILSAFPNSGLAVEGIPYYLGTCTKADSTAKFESLMAADKPFRLRMITRNYLRRLPTY
jgi:hypothetical protein